MSGFHQMREGWGCLLLCTHILSFLVVFSIDHHHNTEAFKPKLTIYTYKKNAVSATFLREALCSMFTELICVGESKENTTVGEVHSALMHAIMNHPLLLENLRYLLFF